MALRLTESEYRELSKSGEKRARTSTPHSKLCWNTLPVGGSANGSIVVLTLPLPPTKNGEPRHWANVRKLRSHWANLAALAWTQAGMPSFDRVSITPVFYLTRNNRDADNCIGEAFKGLQDGLRGRLVPDDARQYLELEKLEFIAGTGTVPRLELWIQEERS